MTKPAKPFVKWVGGKSKLIPEISKLIPNKINNYYEPFMGGGALFFELSNKKLITNHSYINDINKKLMNCYEIIKQDPDSLIKLLKNIEKEYKKLNLDNQKKYFYQIRQEYNQNSLDNLTYCAYLIFLNKTCFNGMYRENSKGEYNIPFGDQPNPTICDVGNIQAVSHTLHDTHITSTSFEESIKTCKKSDFIYFDPPYYPLNTTANFTNYSKNNFTFKEQIKLSETFKQLHQKGCFVMLSNSNTDFIRKLYQPFNIHEVYSARSINSKGEKRGKIKELIITSY